MENQSLFTQLDHQCRANKDLRARVEARLLERFNFQTLAAFQRNYPDAEWQENFYREMLAETVPTTEA